MEIDLRHIHTVKKRLADGTIKLHYYHRGTRKKIDAEPGTLEFIEAYRRAAIKDAPPPIEAQSFTFGDVLRDYKASQDFIGKADSTRREEARMLGHIETKWEGLPALALNDECVRADFLDWRDEIAKRSARQADYYIGLLRTVIQWAWDRRKYGITANHASRAGKMHSATRIDCVWTRDKVLKLYEAAPPHMWGPILFALHSSWRQGDILALDWNDYDGLGFSAYQGKTKQYVYAPCTRAIAGFVARQKERQGHVFLTQSDRPWLSKHFQHSFADLAKGCGIEGLTFHDLRGTVQTALGEAGLSDLQISALTGHKLAGKNQILGSYASRTKLMAQKVIATLETTWLADIGREFWAPTVNQIVNRL